MTSHLYLSDKAGKDNTDNSKYRALTTKKSPSDMLKFLRRNIFLLCQFNSIDSPILVMKLLPLHFISSPMAIIVYVPSIFSSLYPSTHSHFHLTGNKIQIPHFSHLFSFCLHKAWTRKGMDRMRILTKDAQERINKKTGLITS